MAIGALVDAGINVKNQLEDTGKVDVGQVLEHAWEGAVIAGAPVVALFAAPSVIGTSGETIASFGNAVGSRPISTLGTRTMAAGMTLDEKLWESVVTMVTGNPSLAHLADQPLTRGVLYTNGQQIPLSSGRGGPASQMPQGSSGFDIVTRTHVEGNAAALMQQNGWMNGTLYINNIPCGARCAPYLPRMLPPGASLRIIGPDWYDVIFRGLGIEK